MFKFRNDDLKLQIALSDLRSQIPHYYDGGYKLRAKDYILSLESDSEVDYKKILEYGGVEDLAYLLGLDEGNAGGVCVWQWWQTVCLSRVVSLYIVDYERREDNPYSWSLHKRLFSSSGIFHRLLRLSTVYCEATNQAICNKYERMGIDESLCSKTHDIIHDHPLDKELPHPVIYGTGELHSAFLDSFDPDRVGDCMDALADAVAALSYDNLSDFPSKEELDFRRFKGTPEYLNEKRIQAMLLEAFLFNQTDI